MLLPPFAIEVSLIIAIACDLHGERVTIVPSGRAYLNPPSGRHRIIAAPLGASDVIAGGSPSRMTGLFCKARTRVSRGDPTIPSRMLPSRWPLRLIMMPAPLSKGNSFFDWQACYRGYVARPRLRAASSRSNPTPAAIQAAKASSSRASEDHRQYI
jgi:hypothetical protein